ncbi:helix-turn-helix transcriptional regulator [Tahibacter caeni]|uniref:helix-turn-helix transcriptional regulator n=1 Tax=Tahibacter caeni TaxID=1453545 RepID=UPI0021490E6F|nr:helix-turn-helix transcriptional regulator [Tahibacter caeni]
MNARSTDGADATGPTIPAVSARERGIVVAVLLLIAVLVTIDVATDLHQGASVWHVAIEIVAGVAAAAGALYLLHGTVRLRRRLARQASDLSAYRAQAAAWQAQARRQIEGLARSIDRQLDDWKLSAAEKEIAFLLLKGLSLKDIADLRGTGEKTVRAQSAAIYAKAGLGGRSELSAFFLEDLLVPSVAVMTTEADRLPE